MCFLHVLLAVALTLALVRTRSKVTFEHRGRGRVLIVDMTITFFLGRPTIFVILAATFAAFPRPSMSLLMFAMLTCQQKNSTVGDSGAYVKSHGLLKVFSQSRQRWESALGGGTPFRRRPIERSTSSSNSSLDNLLLPLAGNVVSLSALTVVPVLSETDWPFLILTSSTGRPLRLNPPCRPSRSSLTGSVCLEAI